MSGWMPGADDGAGQYPTGGTPGGDWQTAGMPGPPGGWDAAQPMPYAPADEPVVVVIGDIAVTPAHVILPHGRFPLRGSTWTVQDSTTVTESIPAYAIVLAILLFIFCLLGLLFLLIKEKRYGGFIAVSVTGPGYFHSTQFPPGPMSGARVAQLVNHARALTAAAPPVD